MTNGFDGGSGTGKYTRDPQPFTVARGTRRSTSQFPPRYSDRSSVVAMKLTETP